MDAYTRRANVQIQGKVIYVVRGASSTGIHIAFEVPDFRAAQAEIMTYKIKHYGNDVKFHITKQLAQNTIEVLAWGKKRI